MKILQIVAHPAETSFTKSLAAKFADGARSVGHSVITLNPYDDLNKDLTVRFWQIIVQHVDHINFAWPCMWEMPPAKLVELLQTVFVKDYAFELIDDRMVPQLNVPVTCLISLGRDKDFNTANLSEAMQYCGLHPKFFVYKNVGPRLTSNMAELYLETAFQHGASLKEKSSESLFSNH